MRRSWVGLGLVASAAVAIGMGTYGSSGEERPSDTTSTTRSRATTAPAAARAAAANAPSSEASASADDPALRQAYIEARMEESRRDARFAAHETGGRITARNPEQRFEATFESGRVRVRTEGARESVSLSTERIGCGSSLQPAGRTQASVSREDARRVAMRRQTGLVSAEEWFVNGGAGLEQGFTVESAACGDDPLVFEVALEGLAPRLEEGHVVLGGEGGLDRLAYGDLFARDAEGRTLPTRLALAGGRARLEVDVDDARYPIMVDPLLVNLEASLQPDSPGYGVSQMRLGEAVAISGNTAAIASGEGPYGGSVFLFVRAGTTWTVQQRIVNPQYAPGSGTSNAGFAASLALSGDTLAVGIEDRILDEIEEDAYGYGSIAVYVRSGTTWSLQETLVRGTGQGQTTGQGFGRSVSIDGDTLVAGAPGESSSRGAVYVFRRTVASWSVGVRMVSPAGTQSGASFGADVALSGTLLVVGEPGRAVGGNALQGQAYLYQYDGNNFVYRTTMSAGDGAAQDRFGESVDVDITSNRVLVGAPYDDTSVTDGGSAYVFLYNGSTTAQEQKLVPTGTLAQQYCAWDVAIANGHALLGCPNRVVGGVQTGAVQAYARSSSTWSEVGTRSGAHSLAYDHVGRSVAIDGTLGLAGAPGWDEVARPDQGEGLVFQGTTQTFESYLSAGRSAHDDQFGHSVAAHGDTVAVGVPDHDSAAAMSSGAVYVFVRTGPGTYAPQAKLLSPVDASDQFGDAVDLQGDVLVVGAPRHNAVAGAVYVYRRTNGTWGTPTKLVASTATIAPSFGEAVALSGNVLMVGEPYYDGAAMMNVGRVHFFEWNGASWVHKSAIAPSGAASGDFEDMTVDVHGALAVAGAPRTKMSTTPDRGAAYVFRRDPVTGSWSEQTPRLSLGAGTESTKFGLSVAVHGTTILVGAPGDMTSRGTVFAYADTGGAFGSPTPVAPGSGSIGERFGLSMASDGAVLVVGSGFYRVRYFYGSGTSFAEQGTLQAPMAFGSISGFGASVAVTPGRLFVGAPTVSTGNAPNEGRVAAYAVGGFRGDGCSTNAQCGSGFCVDGVCCDGACGGGATDDCQACSVANGAATDGICGPILAARNQICRPADATGCDAAEVCNGVSTSCPTDVKAADGSPCGGSPSGTCDAQDTCSSGTCQPRFATAMTQCGIASCTNGVAVAASFCSGTSTTCVAGGQMSCDAYTCGGSTCRTSCASDSDCQAAYYCSSTTCIAKVADGVACSSPNQCQSGMCAGVCGGDVDECQLGTDNCSGDATCTNTLGSFTCACNDGFTGNGVTCNDVDECATSNGGCAAAPAATCTNTPGSRACACNEGYTGDGVTCTDVDECAMSNGGCSTNPLVSCTNTPGSRSCGACPTGYTGDGVTCTDVDECATNNGGCSTNPLVTCTNQVGSRLCGGCPSGYTGNGVTCMDVDECQLGTDNCSDNATCSNTAGSFSCVCNGGYSGNGQTCTDINECQLGTDNCSDNATCSNVAGTFTCSCNGGFTGNGVSCVDVDECATNNGGCSTSPMVSCTNTPGSRTCGACPSGYAGNGVTCTDVNECAANTDTCTANQACTNTAGSFTCKSCHADASVMLVAGVEECVCNSGHGGDGQTCVANACNPACGTGATCNASFTCVCPTGYGGDPLVACADLDECQLGTDTCSANAVCTNTVGWYSCACADGYTGDGQTCANVDECEMNLDDCASNATCTDLEGSFDCSCNHGYSGDGRVCVLGGVDAGVPNDAGIDGSLGDGAIDDSSVPPDDGGTDSGEQPPVRPAPSVGFCAASSTPGGTGGGSAIPLLALAAVAFRARRRARASTWQLALALVLGASLVVPLRATAQTTDESVARAQFQLGQALLNEGRFHEAAAAFEAAYAASHRAGLLFNAYVAYRDAQELENAANALRRFLAADPSSDTPLMRGRLEALEAQLAEQRAAAEAAERARLEHERLAAERAAAAASGPVEPTDTTRTEPERSSSGRGVAFGLIGGGGGLALVGMLAGGLGASAQNDRVAEHCGEQAGLLPGQCFDVPEVSDAERKSTIFRAIGWSSLAIGVSAAALGTVLLITGGDDEDDAPTVGLAPRCDPTGCSVTVFGRF